MTVRGDQMAEEMNGLCLRCKYLNPASVASAPALIWVVEPSLELVERFHGLTPQILDVINPEYEAELRPAFFDRCSRFRFLMLNTRSSIHHLGPEPGHGWKSWVVPHHHCNGTNWLLSEERLAKPRVVGYVGQPEHLHDTEAIEAAVEKMGLNFVNAWTTHLEAYQSIDIGVAWTRRDTLRDATRSNIKMTNFAAHGIPSVACNYESYRDVNDAATGSACLIRSSLEDFLEGIAELARNEDLRRQIHAQGPTVQRLYSRSAIAEQYRGIIREARAE